MLTAMSILMYKCILHAPTCLWRSSRRPCRCARTWASEIFSPFVGVLLLSQVHFALIRKLICLLGFLGFERNCICSTVRSRTGVFGLVRQCSCLLIYSNFVISDPPRGEEWKAIEGGFAHASDLVKYIRVRKL
jgi:hypothetical protein